MDHQASIQLFGLVKVEYKIDKALSGEIILGNSEEDSKMNHKLSNILNKSLRRATPPVIKISQTFHLKIQLFNKNCKTKTILNVSKL